MEAAIHSRRQIIATLTVSTLATLAPFRAGSALARSGHGGGDGDGGGRGGGSGSGKGGGDSGRGGDKGSDGGGGRGAGRSGEPKSAGSRNSADGVSPATQENSRHGGSNALIPGAATDRSLSVRHSNGIAEEIDSQGRYVMRDNRGRTIVNRSATKSDLDRLRSFVD